MVVAPTLADAVVLLDAHTIEDVAAMVRLEDDEMARRFGWHPRRSTVTDALAAVERWRDDWARSGATRVFAVRLAATRELAGACEVSLESEGRARMSWSIFLPYRGRGLATRAVALVASWAFEAFDVERMEAYVEPDNTASLAVARAARFIEEGLLRGWARHADGRHDMILLARLRGDATRLPGR